ncbi:MAG TPA: isoprenylcysteine carboxylmethyltransferase family protein [Vicinamibacterales bacterium]
MSPQSFVGDAWLCWFASWMLAAWWQDRAVKRATTSSEIAYRVLTMVGAILLFGLGARYLGGDAVLWRPARVGQWMLAAAALTGFAVTWWARLHIGRLWSSGVTRKADHRVVDTGPYGLVRHPIYSGVTLSAVATACMRGTVHAWIGTAILVLGFYVKARLEEGFLREQLGPTYDDYAKRVSMLVPFL